MNIERISSESIPGARSIAIRAHASATADMYAVAGASSSPASANFAPHSSCASRTHGASPPVSM